MQAFGKVLLKSNEKLIHVFAYTEYFVDTLFLLFLLSNWSFIVSHTCTYMHTHTQMKSLFQLPAKLSLSSPPSGSITLFKMRTRPWCLSAITKTLMAAQMFPSRQSIPEKNKKQKKHSLIQPITFTQYCLHHTIRYGYSANPTIAHCLPHTSC